MRLIASDPSRVKRAAAAAVLLLSACGGGQPSAGGGSGTEPPPQVGFVFDGADPAVSRALTGIDELYINPGAVIEQNGQLHMFANVFTAWPGFVQVPHLVSDDGASWTLVGDEPVLASSDIPYAEEGADVSTGFVTEDGTWVLIFETVDRFDPWVLGRATAPGPDGPWTIDPAPILEGGPEGSWDAGGLSWPSVVRTDEGYLMYYTALDKARGGTGAIGLATSPDGESWTKHNEPVLQAELDWEQRKLDRPRVAATPDGLVMVYSGGRLTDRGVAWSNDGISWTRSGDAPAITADDFPVNGNAWDAALVHRDGTLLYYLEIGLASGTTGTEVYLATAQLP